VAAKRWLRRRIFVDYRVQAALVVRVVLYWMLCLLTMAMLLLAWGLFTGPLRPMNVRLTELWAQFGIVAMASLMLLPAVIFDVVKMSNRFVGPVFRLRQSMHDLAERMPVSAIGFREGDFWQEFARDFNTIAARTEYWTENKKKANLPVVEEDLASMLEESVNHR
jgi:hypothetical protein